MWRAEAPAGAGFQRPAVPGCPAVAPGGRGSTGPGVLLPGRRAVPAGQPDGRACRRAIAAVISPAQGQRCGEAEPQAAAAADDAAGDGEQAQPQPFGFPAAGGAGQGEHLRPGEQLAGQRDDLAPDLVLGEAVQRQVPQPGVLGAADPVLAPGPRRCRSSRSASWPRLVLVAKQVNRCPSMSVNRSCAPGCGRSLRTMTRIPSGQPARSSRPVMFGDPGAVADLAVARRRPASTPLRGPCRCASAMSSVMVNPTE